MNTAPTNVNMSVKARTVNSRHLIDGDPLPPFKGTLRVYNMRYCPYAHRVVLILNAKGIDYEVVNISLAQKPAWIYSKNPLGKIPVIEISEGTTLYESLIIGAYLDEMHPEKRRLQAKDPLVRARDKIILECSTAMHIFLIKSIKSPESVDGAMLSSVYAVLDVVQAELLDRGHKFLAGDTPGYVDYMLWPWFERLPVTENRLGKIWPLNHKYGRLTQYIMDMRQDPAVSQYLIPDDITAKFFKGFRENNPRYDLLEDQEAKL